MSKHRRIFYSIFLAGAVTLQIFTNAAAQAVDGTLTVLPGEIPKVRVEGRFYDPQGTAARRNLSFVRSIAGFAIPGERISGVHLKNSGKEPVPAKELIPGEFLAASDYVEFSYTVEIPPFPRSGQAAHASWIAGNVGLLMLNDLFPNEAKRPGKARIRLDLPSGWHAFTAELTQTAASFEIGDLENAVFVVGSDWREKNVPTTGSPITLLIYGQWHFSDDEAAQMASEIYSEYKSMFKADPAGGIQIAISRFPGGAAQGTWQSETRGSNVLVLSGDMPFRTQSLQRLHEQLRHEIFHLWLPNGVELSGNYDWFFEGFALYKSLKTAVHLNRIRFEDLLDTLSRAYEIDKAQPRRISLIDASASRWNGADTQVYARGILVAFLCDIAMLNRSGGKRSVEMILTEIFQKYRPPAEPQDGNAVVLAIMMQYRELAPIIEKYVKNPASIEWTAELALAGIEATGVGRHANLKVIEKPKGRQKALLDKLGYNSWRKLSRSFK